MTFNAAPAYTSFAGVDPGPGYRPESAWMLNLPEEYENVLDVCREFVEVNG